MDKILTRLTGRRFFYRAELVYKTKGYQQIASFYIDISLTRKRFICDHRGIKKTTDLIKRIPKKFLCNGYLEINSISYLGWFKIKKK